jgi:hypothetical protein
MTWSLLCRTLVRLAFQVNLVAGPTYPTDPTH